MKGQDGGTIAGNKRADRERGNERRWGKSVKQ